MSQDGYRWGLYVEQEENLTKQIKDDDTRQRHLRQYQRVVFNLRKTFGLTGHMGDFHAQLLIDEIAISSIRIQEIEKYLYSQFNEEKKWDKDWEGMLIRLKEQRRRAIDSLDAIRRGKGAKAIRGGELAYRDRMNRSKKLQQIQTIEDTLSGKDEPDDTDGQTGDDSKAEETGMGLPSGGDIPLPTEMDN